MDSSQRQAGTPQSPLSQLLVRSSPNCAGQTCQTKNVATYFRPQSSHLRPLSLERRIRSDDMSLHLQSHSQRPAHFCGSSRTASRIFSIASFRSEGMASLPMWVSTHLASIPAACETESFRTAFTVMGKDLLKSKPSGFSVKMTSACHANKRTGSQRFLKQSWVMERSATWYLRAGVRA